MSRLGLLFNLTPTEEQYIDVMLGKLSSLGVTYPTLSNIEVTDTPKIIEALMSKIRFAFLSEFSVYAMHNDFDFDLEWFEHEISLYSYGNNYYSWYAGAKLVWMNYFDLYIFLNSETTFKQLIKDALNKIGYVSSYKVLNSLDFGIPQTRNRVFTISILNGKGFNFDNLQTTPMENIDKFVDKTFYSDKYRVADRTMAVQFGKLPNNPFNGRNMLVGDYARTIVSNYAKVPTSNILAVGDKYRHITEKESLLLMGFDESDYEKAQALYPQRYIGGKECMCGILYRQAGNSIVVLVLQAIVRELKQYF